jgi:hypothetical protein
MQMIESSLWSTDSICPFHEPSYWRPSNGRPNGVSTPIPMPPGSVVKGMKQVDEKLGRTVDEEKDQLNKLLLP